MMLQENNLHILMMIVLNLNIFVSKLKTKLH